MEFLIEEEHAREVVDTLHVIKSVKTIALHGTKNGTSYDNLYACLVMIADETLSLRDYNHITKGAKAHTSL